MRKITDQEIMNVLETSTSLSEGIKTLVELDGDYGEILPILRRVIPNVIADDIVGVSPFMGPIDPDDIQDMRQTLRDRI